MRVPCLVCGGAILALPWYCRNIAILPLVLVEALDDRLKRLQVVKVRLCGLVAAEFDRTTKKHRCTVWR
jgi:hypothetical protein